MKEKIKSWSWFVVVELWETLKFAVKEIRKDVSRELSSTEPEASKELRSRKIQAMRKLIWVSDVKWQL